MDRNGLVATVTLDRPEARNALDRELMVELTQMISALSGDGTRVIVLTGAGSAFCAGADIEWMRKARDLEHDANVADAAMARTMFETIDACPRPIIARVNGHALGGGAGLVACADVAVAVSGATFGFTETRLGLIPAAVSPYVLRTIGPGHARALFTTGERFDAAARPRDRARPPGLRARPARARGRRPRPRLPGLRPGRDRGRQAARARCHCEPGAARPGRAACDHPRRQRGPRGLDAFLGKRPPTWSPESHAS